MLESKMLFFYLIEWWFLFFYMEQSYVIEKR